jgi:prolyl oligopeptidase PreP (S9A serine peptidase family)
VSGYESVHAFATAKDGTRIPYSLIHKKGIKLDGANPTWISAYGSYGLAATDPRVAPFHVAKMAARLQAASKSGKPVLLRVDYDAGHGIGSTRAQQDREAADTYAFLLWQTGVPGYQPG